MLTGLRVVKAFGQEDREQERFVGRSREGVRARLRLAMAEGAYGLLVGFIVAGGSAAVLLVGGRLVRAGSITLGELPCPLPYGLQASSTGACSTPTGRNRSTTARG